MRYHLVEIVLSVFLLIIIFNFNVRLDNKIISEEEFSAMINTNFDDLDSVVKLFPASPDDVKKRLELIKKRAYKRIEDIINIEKNKRTYDNTVRAFDDSSMEYSIVLSSLSAFELVCPNDLIRESCKNAVVDLRQFFIDLFSLNRDLYKAIIEYRPSNDLSDDEKYFLSEIIKDFERNGLNLCHGEFEKVKKLKKEIAKLSSDFGSNISNDKSQIIVTREELDGLSDDFIDNLKRDGDYFVLGCDYPTYFEVILNCEVSFTREKLSKTFKSRAYPDNKKILDGIIKKRDQLAKLLGFESYAALDLDDQMVKTPQRAEDFLVNLAKKASKKELKEFELFKKCLPDGVRLTKSGKFTQWDFPFVKEQYKKRNFNIDENKIAEYFPVQKTLYGIFNIYQKFLGLRFEEVDLNTEVEGKLVLWHDDVKVVRIYDDEKKLFLGYLFLDLYPRENKYSHACMSEVVPGIWRKDIKSGHFKSVPAIIFVVANFPKATKGKPALLKHNDVETFFHEFGHAMHGFLGKTRIAHFAGTETKVDFVEMPSQMFEEWMWDKDMLSMISSHYKTGEPLPLDLIDKKIKLKRFDKGFFTVRQCWLALYSLKCFEAGEEKDTDKIKKDLHNRLIKSVEIDDEDKMEFAFGHLTGYGAKYYSYMWSKVFALDIFDRIKSVGLLNKKEGRKLIDDILSKGGSLDPNKLLRRFLGREPNQKAFLRDLGLDE